MLEYYFVGGSSSGRRGGFDQFDWRGGAGLCGQDDECESTIPAA